jgi:uncharacterized damage-inducible protein DinB
MSLDASRRPEAGEHLPYFSRYIQLVPDGNLLETLTRQIEETVGLLAGLSPERADHRYAPGKWSVRQLVGHVADCERVFGFRALTFARGDAAQLPGFEENDYAEASPAPSQPLAEVLDDLQAVRRATLTLLRGLGPEAWPRTGLANGARTSVRALAWIIAGHELHHRAILRERYLNRLS